MNCLGFSKRLFSASDVLLALAIATVPLESVTGECIILHGYFSGIGLWSGQNSVAEVAAVAF